MFLRQPPSRAGPRRTSPAQRQEPRTPGRSRGRLPQTAHSGSKRRGRCPPRGRGPLHFLSVYPSAATFVHGCASQTEPTSPPGAALEVAGLEARSYPLCGPGFRSSLRERRVRSNPVASSTSRVFLALYPGVCFVKCVSPHPRRFAPPLLPTRWAKGPLRQRSSQPPGVPQCALPAPAGPPLHLGPEELTVYPLPIIGWIDPGGHQPGPLDPITPASPGLTAAILPGRRFRMQFKEQAGERARRTSVRRSE